MDVEQIRRINLNYWADKLGRSVLAEKMGYRDTVYLNQLCGGFGSFGKNTARKAERALGLEHGWFDKPHPEASGDNDIQSLIIGELEGLSEENRQDALRYLRFLRASQSGDA